MSLSKIKSQYEHNLRIQEEKINKKLKKLLEENAEIKEIEEKINELDSLRIQKILSRVINSKEIENITKKIKTLENLRKEKINELNLPDDFFKIKYNCDICKDTGVVKINGRTKNCKCITQKLLNEKYNNSNLINNENEIFSNFNLKYFENKEINGINQRKNAEEILKLSKKFVEAFGKKEKNIKGQNKIKNLIFIGKTGLGKTFLSNAIAKEIIKKGYTIFYQTAPIMMDELMLNKFQDSSKYYEMIDQIKNVDLLIIDDLGAETLSESKMKEIFSIINVRLIKDKSTIISTNLDLDELAKAYDDRIFSRIIGNYVVKKFVGEDIRILKKKNIKYE